MDWGWFSFSTKELSFEELYILESSTSGFTVKWKDYKEQPLDRMKNMKQQA